MDVHLRDLRYFVAVAEELHFTRAAERLFISQPALSRQIAKLESDLRVGLLIRDRRRVELTAAGRVLLDEARSFLVDWDATRRAVSDAAAGAASVLRIGMQTSIGRGIVAALTDGLAARRPGWTVQLKQVSWDDPTAGLNDGTSDVSLCWLPLVDGDRFLHAVVASEPRLLAVAADSRLAGRSSIRFADMVDEPLVALPADAGAVRDFWLVADRRDAEAPIAGVARTADEAMEAVVSGLGSVLISEGNAAIYRRPGVAFITVEDLAPSTLAVVWRADDHRPVIRDLAHVAGAIADGLPSSS
ncbi:MAG: LysR family transcriptional regulator [Actinomycetota bacterium]